VETKRFLLAPETLDRRTKMMKTVFVVLPIALAAGFLAWSQANSGRADMGPLDGTWELVSGQQLPKGARDIKVISGGHFIFVAYDAQTGKPLYTGGGTYVLNGTSYTEHMDFASDQISAGLIGKDQPFTVKIDGDTFTQTGTLSNGKGLSETWKRMN
jgi:hypothetical protein